MSFELKDRDGLGRIGILETKHGKVETPVLMPVINPKIQTIPVKKLIENFKAKMFITNSYIIHKDPQLREIALSKGVHKLLEFNGPLMTDSGSFQLYMYGDVQVDPIEIVRFQRDIGSDIGVILDIFREPDVPKEQVKADIEETLRRAKLSIKEKGDMLLAVTVQGGKYLDLRKYCAKEMAKLDADIYPIGGVVPFMENYRFRELVEIIMTVKQHLPPCKPIHLFGCGHPMIFALAVLLGCDMFDSASYSKYALDNRLMFPTGTIHLNNLEYLPCSCPICSKYDVSDLREMPKEERIRKIAEHNLYVSFEEIRRVKQAIREGSLWELVEMRVRSHPNLLEAYRVLKKYVDIFEQYDPIVKKSAFFYTGSESLNRPEPYRYAKRLIERYSPPQLASILLLLPDKGVKPYTKYYGDILNQIRKRGLKNVHIAFLTIFGVVPFELEEVYPIQQSVVPKIFDKDAIFYIGKQLEEYLTRNSYSKVFYLKGMNDFDEVVKEYSKKFKIVILNNINELPTNLTETLIDRNEILEKLRCVADYQFGKGAGKALFEKDKITWKRSRETGKIRYIYKDGELLLSLVPTSGFFTLTIKAAKILLESFKPPKLRVAVNADAEPFVKRGRSVFSKFVVDNDPEIRPGEEVIVVNREDELLAIGKSILAGTEFSFFKKGVAIKIRKTI